MEEIIEYPYKIESIVLSKNNMSLVELPNQRHIRTTQVNSILKRLKQGCHFDSMFVVNVNNGKKKIRVIDGGHRTEALKKYFEKHPDKKIRVSMAIYKDLSEAEERAVYTKWNLGVKQSVEDFIWSYRDEIPQYDKLLIELPVTVYGTSEKLKLRYIIDAYLSSKKYPFTGGCSYDKLEWLEVFKNLNPDDVESMVDTFKIIMKIFNPNKRIDFIKTSPFKFSNFKALYRLIHTNRVLLGENYVIKRMKNTLYNKSILDQFRAGHKQMTVEAFNIYKQMLNQNVDHKFQ